MWQYFLELPDDSEAPLTEVLASLAGVVPSLGLDHAPSVESVPQPKLVSGAAYPEGPVKFTVPLPPGHSGLIEGRVDRQWITFISFTSSKIAKEFSAASLDCGLTGFLLVDI